jgi:nucleoside phosphorylase
VRRPLLALLFATLALASCGGGDDKENVQDVLDKAFSSSINSADLKLDASFQLKGSPGLDKPVRITAAGPFRTNEGKLPSVDIDLKVGTDGGGQTVTTGFLTTGDRAFVKFQDIYYEQPKSQVAKANRALAENKNKRGSLRALGLDPRSWLGEAKDEGDEEIA